MKFVDRGEGWNSVKANLQAEASETGRSVYELAGSRTQSYFRDANFFAGPFSVMMQDFRTEYLIGGSEFEARLRWGLYDSTRSNSRINWFFLVFHEFWRLPILILGGVGLLFRFGHIKYPGLFAGVALGCSLVGLLGLAGGRHLVNLMPLLIIGTASILSSLKYSAKTGLLPIAGVFLLGLIGFNVWQATPSDAWSNVYHNYLVAIGKKHTPIDGIQLRKLKECKDRLFLSSNEFSWNIFVRSSADHNESYMLQAGDELIRSDQVSLLVRPNSEEIGFPSIRFVVNNGLEGEIPLDTGRRDKDWLPLSNTCIEYSRFMP